mmetsp:Transcript_14926/g.58509  ORF Transcript_14926/g.58509 Transcript_14926/m.58509 type:complete len:379 (-) Transcript_14926:1626-2762(-)
MNVLLVVTSSWYTKSPVPFAAPLSPSTSPSRKAALTPEGCTVTSTPRLFSTRVRPEAPRPPLPSEATPTRATFGNSPATRTHRTKSSLSSLRLLAGEPGENPASSSLSRSCVRVRATSCIAAWLRFRSAHVRRLSSEPIHCSNALTHARWSDLEPLAALRLAATASALSPPRAVNTGLHDTAAAAVSTGDKHPITHPITSILPTRGSTGRSERWKPRGVVVTRPPKSPSTTTAPIARNLSTAARTAFASGGSSASPSTAAGCSPGAIANARITRVSSGAVRISGSSRSAIFAAFFSYSRTQTPARTRPARPLRCAALAALHHPSVKLASWVRGSCVIRFTRPVSMTTVTSGMVTDVSAAFVARTTLTSSGGAGAKANR